MIDATFLKKGAGVDSLLETKGIFSIELLFTAG